MVAGTEFTRRQALRGRGRCTTRRHCDGPDLTRPIAVDEARACDAIGAVCGLCDDSDVALVRRLFGFRDWFGRELVGPGRGREGDRFPVGRPDRICRALRQVGHGSRLSAAHRDQIELGGLRPAVLFGRTSEHEVSTVGRPARRRVPLAAGERARGLAPIGRCDPDGRVVLVLLLVGCDAHEGHARSVRRDLRIGDPYEGEEVLLRNRPALGRGDREGSVGRPSGNRENPERDQMPSHYDVPRCDRSGI